MKAAQAAGAEYDARIRRADYLSSAHAFAREVLRFYSRLAEFQKTFSIEIKRDLGTELLRRNRVAVRSGCFPFDSIDVLPRLTTFLALLGEIAPAALAAGARQISLLDASSQRSLLAAYWEFGGSDQLIGPFAQFVPRAFLQPVAELMAGHASAPPAVSTKHDCPLCGGQPLIGVLRPEGDGGKRRMVCSFCLQEWDFRRIYCPACGEDDEKKLPVYVAEQFPHVRVEACETCKTYVRTIDLTKDGNAVPLVDDLAAIPLSLWAQEHGYTRMQPNLLGT
jgi:FdhE protein